MKNTQQPALLASAANTAYPVRVTGREHQTAEGALIEAAQMRAGLSHRQAASKAGMSDARWRHIVHGYRAIGGGRTEPVRAPDDTLARMAWAVGVTQDQLRATGRVDAALELKRIQEFGLDPLEDPHASIEDQLKAIRDDPRFPDSKRRMAALHLETMQALIDDAKAQRRSDTA